MADIIQTAEVIENKDIINPTATFISTVYTIEKTEFLDTTLKVSNEALEVAKKDHKMNETYPVVMSTALMGNPVIKDLEVFIAQSGWVILDGQGYDMSSTNTYVSELWCQEHFKYSGMEQHVHQYGVLLSGFYFLETPEEGSLIEFHDPRPGKVQTSLKFKDITKITEASNSIFIQPKPGMLVISNSWLPHSFTRNASDKPCKFIHFNISIMPAKKEEAIVI